MIARDRVSIGVVAAPGVSDADEYVSQYMVQAGADFAVLPIVAAHTDQQTLRQSVSRGYFAVEELVVKSAASAYCIVGSMGHVDWAGSDNGSNSTAERVVGMAMEYAAHIGLHGVVASTLNEGDGRKDIEYARTLMEYFSSAGGAPAIARLRIGGGCCAEEAWGRWNVLRHACNHDSRLQLMLELDLAPNDVLDVSQWRAEPVQIVQLPASMFTKNKAGYPVLARMHQEAVAGWMEMGVALVVDCGGNDAMSAEAVSDYIRYLRHLAAQREKQRDAAEAASADYYDVLQAPLQPLADHLDSATYEVFEQDAAKYEAYEDAIYRAIRAALDRNSSRRLVLTVAGAGRGPLVARALQAARRCDADVSVYAVEKNPSAMVELQRKNAELWGGRVKLVHGDMRNAAVAERADILVSELLGSLGDNELSPECLDAAIPLLLAPDGVCIPRKYTAYAAPMSSTVLFNRARSSKTSETPFVVNIHAANVLADAQPLWSFEHSAIIQKQPDRPASPAENGRRSACRVFDIRASSLVHGLAGYFDAELYPGVDLSICPTTHTPAMHSWFPMYFPLARPISVRAGDSLAVHLWRRSSNSKVWYEWAVSVEGGDVSSIHNFGAREYRIDK
ncbi:hypothetical protein EV177_002926 [Coemansia sp. RSA 1804]|nr:hypothetical protein EV177_002926 [Coemansia sp. RSA 1804]